MKTLPLLLASVLTIGIAPTVAAEQTPSTTSEDPQSAAELAAVEGTEPSDSEPVRLSVIQGTIAIDADGAFVEPKASDAVVYLASHPALDPPEPDAESAHEPPPISERPHIVQYDRAFSPELLVVPQYTHVEFPNWDRFSHNVFSRSAAAPPFDLDRYAYGYAKTYQFIRTGVVQVFCNIHPNMRATVLVTPNRYFAQAGEDGRFMLPDVPPGAYDLVIWHPRCAERRQSVQVEPDQATELTVTLKRAAAEMARSDHRQPRGSRSLTRGLAVGRERLDVPVVQEAHAACECSHPVHGADEEPASDEAAR